MGTYPHDHRNRRSAEHARNFGHHQYNSHLPTTREPFRLGDLPPMTADPPDYYQDLF